MSTPPPLPPKSPSIAPSTRTYRSTTTYSGSDGTTETRSPARPTHAQRGIRTNASSIHLTGSISMALKDPFVRQNEDEDVDVDDDWVSESELANLPWAEPPPRDPSPYPTGLARQPSLSFLTSDPAKANVGGDTISRRSSKSSIASRRSQSHLTPGTANPAGLLSPAQASHRLSAQTVHSFQSGMADVELDSQSHSVEQLGPTPPRTKDDSPRSAMAVRATSPLSHRSDSISSMLRKARSLKSTKSTKSTTSSKKRISNSTIHRRSFQKRYGKWDLVEMSPLLEEDAKRREAELELSALLGRATVLERMLQAGKRVSSVHYHLHEGDSNRQVSGPFTAPSLKRLTSRSTQTSSRPSPLETPRTVRTIRTLSTRSSLRHPFRRRREDQFTEIDSQSNHGSTRVEAVIQDAAHVQEKERHWVVLVPDKHAPPLPIEHDISPDTCVSFICASDGEKKQAEEIPDRALFLQSPHLGHREPDHHKRQSVLSYISVGRWSNSTRGGRRRRKLVLGISIGCVVGVILLTGLLAGLLARRSRS